MKIRIGLDLRSKVAWSMFLGCCFLLSQIACSVNVGIDCLPCPCPIEHQGIKYQCFGQVCLPEGSTQSDVAKCGTEQKEETLPEGKEEALTEITPEESTPEEGTTPEETAMPEEAVTEDGGTEREPEHLLDDPSAVVIISINGNGSERPIAYGSEQRPNDANEAKNRFQDSWSVVGQNLDRVDTWILRNQQTNQDLTLTPDNKDSVMISLKLPPNLVAGAFLLLGLISGQTVVQAQTFVLQGERGEKGDQGDAAGLSPAEATLLKALLAKIKLNTNGNNLEIASDEIALKTKSFSIQGDTNQTSFTLDDNTQNITFSHANVHIQNGSGQTTNNNSRGNLIIGYNEQGTTPKTRTGSHNLILGIEHAYSRHGSIISGQKNTVEAPYASAIGGFENIINSLGEGSVSIAGEKNKIGLLLSAKYAASVAGQENTTSGTHAATMAGQNNSASGTHAATMAGQNNSVSGNHAATVAGGGTLPQNSPPNSFVNQVGQTHSAVVGGYNVHVLGNATRGASSCSSFNLTLNDTIARNGACCQGTP